MPASPSQPLLWAHPIVQDWFAQRFGAPTEPQTQGWPHILAGKDTLISAPTGSGKTLAAFLACIDRLVRKALAGELLDRTEVLYVSPLKALSNDIQMNLEVPLAEITRLAGEKGLLLPPIRTAVRTGDTLTPERRAMLKRPPHILVTTPESLYILLTAEKSRALLETVETVIVDEIHAVADDKRGTHLALSLERLNALVTGPGRRQPPVRIGLSATQKPIQLVARFLAGNGRPEPAIVDIGHRRQLDLAVEVPGSELGPVASNEMWEEVYDRIAELAGRHRSTLVFVNTRRLAERVTLHLSRRLGEKGVAAHHGSLSRRLRLAAEKRLKSGETQLLVATASLELGIDVGSVELVCQIGSPRSIAVLLQRIGRSGHWLGAVAKGRLFALTRDELVECAALVRAVRRGELDGIQVPECPLDVLAQQIVAACASEEWKEDDLFALVRRAYPYRDLPRPEFDALLAMLAEGIAARRGRLGTHVHRDRVNGRVRGRRGSRLAAILNGGAIPENALYSVVAEPEGAMVGTVDEDFAVESMSGDVMLLGNSSWRIRRVESKAGRLLVEDAQGAAPNVPFWRGEAPGRTFELSAQVSELRAQVSDRLAVGSSPQETARAWVKEECGLDDSGAEQLVEYLAAGRAALGVVPTQTTVVAERFFDEAGGMQLVIHAPFGGRINKAWGLALRKRFCRSFGFELQAAATDDGLNISLGEQHSFPLSDVFGYLHARSVKPVLEQAALVSPVFATRWRWDATRALALPRFRGGAKIPLHIRRMLADDLLAAVFPGVAECQDNREGDIEIPDHPLVREVMKDVLTEAMDLPGLLGVLSGIADGTIQSVAVDTTAPSPFSQQILNANPYAYLDDAPLEERRARAVSMRRVLPQALLSEIGRLDPAAVAQVRRQAWPDVRDADELQDVLETLVALPEDFAPFPDESSVAIWTPHLDELISERRAARATIEGRTFWVAAGKARSFAALFPGAKFVSDVAQVEPPGPSPDDALRTLVRGWLALTGPATARGLGQAVGLPAAQIEAALLWLEAEGTVLRGQYTRGDDVEWCDRRLLARIHRLTLETLREQIKPVTPAKFMRWLLRWQHVAPGTQLLGERGVLEAIKQLQGFEAPANTWEPYILRHRVADYDPEVLDRLCLTGAVGWGRLSPHPATIISSAVATPSEPAGGRRVVPSSVAPITFFVREEADWMMPRHTVAGRLRDSSPPSGPSAEQGLSHAAVQVAEFLRVHGASFFADLVRGTGRLKSGVEMALWELVAAGKVTADGFDNLRALIDPKRRAGQGKGRAARPRHSTGRWSLLFSTGMAERSRAAEAIGRVLLGRYGVVLRELFARENFALRWREVLMALRRLEDRGEVRGGRFVDGFLGEQFALPLAVESLRAARKIEPSGETVVLSAADPLNLVGVIIPGERVPAISGRFVAMQGGIPSCAASAARVAGAGT